jgi:hypothetical protein
MGTTARQGLLAGKPRVAVVTRFDVSLANIDAKPQLQEAA